jgi:DNA-directed RNA polymerase subunit beta
MSAIKKRLISRNQIEKKKDYSQFHFSTEIPNLIDVQRERFYSFIEHGLKQAFQEPLRFSTTTHDLEILFFPEFVQFRKPDLTQKKASVLGKTYGSSVYMPIGIRSKSSSFFRVEWLFVGVLPLMTQQGHFLINGIPRVVLHQMIRNPGIYTIPRDSRTQSATIRIVPEKGGWINLTVDKKNRVWFSTRSLRRKVSLLVFLQALGLSSSEVLSFLKNSQILQNSIVKPFLTGKSRHDQILENAGLLEHPRTQQEACRYLYSHFLQYSPYIRKNSEINDFTAREFFSTTIWNKDKLILGKIGRQQFREKVGSPEPESNWSLTVDDLLRASQALLDLIYKERIGDEIDSLTQKRIRGCDDFLLEQLVIGIKDFEVFFQRKLNSAASSTPKNDVFVKVGQGSFKKVTSFLEKKSYFGEKEGKKLIKPSPLIERTIENPIDLVWRQNKAFFSKTVSKSWKRFFTSGTLAQFMDQTNPLAEVTHKRRLTVLGPGGISNKQTTIQIRGIHPTYYGRFCPIETPEGQNAGLVNSFTIFATLSNDLCGTVNTPFFPVYKGQVQRNLPPLSISPRTESQLIGTQADIELTPWNVLPKSFLPVRKELNFDYELSTKITTQSVGILQNLSVATSLIPFLEHDDANRALMGSNMQRQAVPVLTPQAPLVGTGLETRVLSDGHYSLQVSQSGYITKVTSQTIKILTPKKFPYRVSQLSKKFPSSWSSKLSPILGKGSFSRDLMRLSPTLDPTNLKQKLWEEKNNQSLSKPKIISILRNSFYPKKTLFSPLYKSSRAVFPGKTARTLRDKFYVNLDFANLMRLRSYSNKKNQFNFGKKFTKPLILIRAGSIVSVASFGLQKTSTMSADQFFVDQGFGVSSLQAKGIDHRENRKTNKLVSSILLKDNFQDTNSHKTYNVTKYQRTNQSTCLLERPIFSEKIWVEKGDILVDGAASSQGKLSIGQNILVAYLPWEGYNFEDAILINQRLVDEDIFTSLHLDHYDIEVKNTQYGLERITNQVPLKTIESDREKVKIEKLDSRGLVEIGSWVEEGDYLVGKVSPLNPKRPSIESQYEKLYNAILKREKPQFRNSSLRVPKGVQGFVLGIQILPAQEPDVAALAEKDDILRVRVILLQKRKIQVGDKMAGRHGNKGIVSKILPCHDMPYLPDGTPIDIVLNPLGVPSRMNVGQILECLLGLAGRYLEESYTTNLFDERFGAESSRSAVYSKLYEASIKSRNPWLFEPHHPGKIRLFDGRTGLPFDQPITVGCAYILKLVHLVDDKIHARSTGPYSAVTQQPVRGRSRNGGQRLGEMEVWALQAYGAAATLHELLTLKSDDIEGRKQTVVQIYAGKSLPSGSPESFKVILRELQALCFDLQLYQTPLESLQNKNKEEKLSEKQVLPNHLPMSKRQLEIFLIQNK